MAEYIEKFLNYHFWDIPFGRIGGFIAVFLILMGVRYFIIRWVLQILKKMAEKTKNNTTKTSKPMCAEIIAV